MQPQLGLVCITHSTAVRYRSLTLSRYKHFPVNSRGRILEELYRHNLKVLLWAIKYCSDQDIRLYRIPSSLFPLHDLPDGVGLGILETLRPDLAWVGFQSVNHGIRLVTHPEPFVVLNSLSDAVIENSIQTLENQAQLLDWMGLPKSPWSAINIHGGKAERAEVLSQTIRHLNASVRLRLTLENDESSYGAEQILEVCQTVNVPMTFDVHHHLVRERLESYEDPSIARYTTLAAQTWPRPEWQIVHLSNGRSSLHDRTHHDLIQIMPSSLLSVPWLEVEAKYKELAIAHLKQAFDEQPISISVMSEPQAAGQHALD